MPHHDNKMASPWRGSIIVNIYHILLLIGRWHAVSKWPEYRPVYMPIYIWWFFWSQITVKFFTFRTRDHLLNCTSLNFFLHFLSFIRGSASQVDLWQKEDYGIWSKFYVVRCFVQCTSPIIEHESWFGRDCWSHSLTSRPSSMTVGDCRWPLYCLSSPLFPVLWHLLQMNVATATPLFYVVHPLSFGSSLVT